MKKTETVIAIAGFVYEGSVQETMLEDCGAPTICFIDAFYKKYLLIWSFGIRVLNKIVDYSTVDFALKPGRLVIH
jgi:hypothetical protein